MSESRKDVLLKAIEAEVGGASVDPGTLFTDDVVGWSPYATVSGLAALAALAALREDSVLQRRHHVPRTRRGGQQGVRRMGHRSRSHGATRPRRGCGAGSDGTACPVGRRHCGRLPRREDPVLPDVLRRHLADRADRRRLTSRSPWSSTSRTIRIRSTSSSSKRRSVVRRPPPWDSATKSTWRSSCATPARSSPASADGPGATAASCRTSGSTPSLRGRGLATRLLAAAEAEAAARGCTQTVHFTYDFQARALYEQNGYELVGRVEDFPSGTDVLWYRKRLDPTESPPSRERL